MHRQITHRQIGTAIEKSADLYSEDAWFASQPPGYSDWGFSRFPHILGLLQNLASGICGGQSGDGTGFLLVLRFPLPKPFIPQTSLSSQSPGAGTVGQEWPQCRVDPVWTPSPNIQIKKIVQNHKTDHDSLIPISFEGTQHLRLKQCH
jgi:hypothetical protein